MTTDKIMRIFYFGTLILTVYHDLLINLFNVIFHYVIFDKQVAIKTFKWSHVPTEVPTDFMFNAVGFLPIVASESHASAIAVVF